MKTSVSFSQLCDAFTAMGRADQFSYDAKRAIYDHIEELHEGEYELDVIALCVEISESDIDELVNDYSIDVSEAEDDEEEADIVEGYLNDNTSIIAKLSNGSFVYFNF